MRASPSAGLCGRPSVLALRVATCMVALVALSGCQEFTSSSLEPESGASCVVSAVETFYALDVTASGDRAYVAASADGLQVIDISDPLAPRIMGSVATPDQAWGVAVSGNHAFLACEDEGLQVVDVTNAEAPVILGGVRTTGRALRVAATGDYAYVVDYTGFHVVDVRTPAAPEVVGTLDDVPGVTKDVAVSGDYAFLAALTRFLVIDIRTPESPQVVGEVPTFFAHGLAVSGSFAYVADGGLRVMNVTDPFAPRIEASLSIPDASTSANGVSISGDFAYVAAQFGDIHVFDITAPSNPQYVGLIDTPQGAWNVATSGDHALVADGPAGLQVLMARCVD